MSQWTCKDGRVMDVVDMATNHLSNAIAMLRAKGVVTMADIESLKASFHRMSDEEKKETLKAVKGMKISGVLVEMEAELLKRYQAGESR